MPFHPFMFPIPFMLLKFGIFAMFGIPIIAGFIGMGIGIPIIAGLKPGIIGFIIAGIPFCIPAMLADMACICF